LTTGVRECFQSAILIPMANHEDRPLGAIFIFDGQDLAVQPGVEAAEGFIEPYDAAELAAFDELGRRLQAQVIGKDCRSGSSSSSSMPGLSSRT